MTTRRIGRVLAICIALMCLAVGANAQQTVYKWVDEEGVVHFGEAPPDGIEAERFTTDTPPPAPPPRPTSTVPESGAETPASSQPARQQAVTVPTAVATPLADMTLAELDRRCDQAREAKIAPLREAEIAHCKAQPRSDPAFCESHNADFGDGGRTMNGGIRPRMFGDLPACVDALQERNRRGI
jgi:hypothetical protein